MQRIFTLTFVVVSGLYAGNAQDWIQNFKITEQPRISNNSFGFAISTFDGIAAFGADQAHIGTIENAGKVYLAKVDCEGWSVYQELISPTPADYSGFGFRVLLKDNWLLVSGRGLISGNHSVFVYEKGDDDRFTLRQRIDHPEQTINEGFGFQFDMANNVLIISAVNRSIVGSNHYLYPVTKGSAYVYVYGASGNWSFTQKIEAGDGQPQDHFGESMSMDGNTLVIGAPREGPDVSGAAYVFTRNPISNTYTQIEKLVSDDYRGYQTNYGFNVKIDDGIIAVSSGQDPNYDYDNLITGVTNSNGAVYMYKEESPLNWMYYQKITITDATAAELRFGDGLQIYLDQLAVGGEEWIYDSSGSLTDIDPKVYMFKKDGSDTWSLSQIIGPNQNSSTYGTLISIYEQDMFVNAYWDNYDENDQNYISSTGSVYVYNTYEFEATEKPVLKPAPVLRACANLGSGFSTSFDLSNIEENLVEGASEFNFTYWDEQGMELHTPLPETYSNIRAYNDIISVRISNKKNAHCFEETEIKLETFPAFEMNEVSDLVMCGSDGTGFAEFDISGLSTSLVDKPDDYIFLIYNELGESITDVSIPYRNTRANGEKLTIVVSDKSTLCTREQTVFLQVLSPVENELPALYSCDFAANGLIAFDTSALSNELLQGQTNKKIHFLNENDILLGNALPNPYYMSPESVLTITALIEDITSGCLTETEITFSSMECSGSPPGGGTRPEDKILSQLDIPLFFTPNADGVNETWFISSKSVIPLDFTVYIFDRYGKLLKAMDINNSWDGTYQGQRMPSSDYWFKLTLDNSILTAGHFTLKR